MYRIIGCQIPTSIIWGSAVPLTPRINGHCPSLYSIHPAAAAAGAVHRAISHPAASRPPRARSLARVIAAVDHLHRRDRLLIQLSISCHLLSSTRPTDKLPHRLIYCIRQVAPMCTRRIVHVHWAHINLSPKSILIGSAVLQGSLGYQTKTQADTHRHETCYICICGPHRELTACTLYTGP